MDRNPRACCPKRRNCVLLVSRTDVHPQRGITWAVFEHGVSRSGGSLDCDVRQHNHSMDRDRHGRRSFRCIGPSADHRICSQKAPPSFSRWPPHMRRSPDQPRSFTPRVLSVGAGRGRPDAATGRRFVVILSLGCDGGPSVVSGGRRFQLAGGRAVVVGAGGGEHQPGTPESVAAGRLR